MKFISCLAILLLSCVKMSTIEAAEIRAERHADSPEGTVWSIYLYDIRASENVDTIIVSISDCLTDRDTPFRNIDSYGVDGFTPRPPGDPFTYVNALLQAPPAFGGNGFTVLGLTVTEEKIEFTAGPLGEIIDTENGPGTVANGIFLANMVLAGSFGPIASVQLVSQGNVVSHIQGGSLCPEPTSLVLAAVGVVGLACAPRRRCCSRTTALPILGRTQRI